jgi:hypothetical protein
MLLPNGESRRQFAESLALMTEPIEYIYKPKIGGVVLGLFFFGGISFAFGRMALTNDRGLILNGFHLGLQGANIFYWLIAAASGGFTALCVLGLAAAFLGKNDGVLRLTETGLEIPQGVLKKTRTVPFTEMSQIKVHIISGQHFLVIQQGQKKVQISQSALPDSAAWEHVCKTIAERAAKGAR